VRALPKTAPGLVSAAAQATTYLSLKNCAQPYFIERIENPTQASIHSTPGSVCLSRQAGVDIEAEQQIPHCLHQRIEPVRHHFVDSASTTAWGP